MTPSNTPEAEKAKTALERAEQFIVNGIDLGYIRMPDVGTPDSAHETLPAIRAALTALRTAPEPAPTTDSPAVEGEAVAWGAFNGSFWELCNDEALARRWHEPARKVIPLFAHPSAPSLDRDNAEIARLDNCGTYLAKDNTGQWHYLNHANTWQAYQGPVATEVDGYRKLAADWKEDATFQRQERERAEARSADLTRRLEAAEAKNAALGRAGVEAAARYVEALWNAHAREFGVYDYSTNVTEFTGANEDIDGLYQELIEGIRSLDDARIERARTLITSATADPAPGRDGDAQSIEEGRS